MRAVKPSPAFKVLVMTDRSNRTRSSRSGLTLVEVMVSLLLVTMSVAGLYQCGILAEKSARYNELSIEVNALVLQKLEETIALPYESLESLDASVLDTQVNSVKGTPLVRRTSVIGHLANGTVVSNLADSVYIEICTRGTFSSPVSRRDEERVATTLVFRP